MIFAASFRTRAMHYINDLLEKNREIITLFPTDSKTTLRPIVAWFKISQYYISYRVSLYLLHRYTCQYCKIQHHYNSESNP